MNSVDLQFFAAVATSGGISRAAIILNTVQSNVTGRIRRLEDELGAPLFYRDSKGVSLTSAGERLLPYALHSSQILVDAKRAVDGFGEPEGLLSIGSMETTAALRLPSLFSGYLQKYPKVDLHLETGPTLELLHQVQSREIEGAFVAEPVSHEGLVVHTAFEEQLVFIAPAKYEKYAQLLACMRESTAMRILVFRSGCSYRRHLERFLVAEGITNSRYMELGTLDGIIGCVAAGMGISLIPRTVAEATKGWRDIAIHEMPGKRGLVSTVYIHRQDLLVSPAHQRFIEEMKSAMFRAEMGMTTAA
ncbi:LysR family transcriptional regulator [Pseudomonas sp. NA-150]|uniref:LysR family transcriptional regulator n=1 Tax=Pseudomonas sp. NA-150 TaxID=3367525 RepID=UPI0037C9B5D6